MLENVANVCTIFGSILLVMSVFATWLMQKVVVRPDCPQDVANVKRNRRWSKGLLVVSIVMLIIGIMGYICMEV